MKDNLNSLIKWVENQRSTNHDNNLKRVTKALKDFQIDFSNTKKIHVAGTNGKGSVCMYATNILLKKGYRVGTYNSPYLTVFNERILIDGKNISDEMLEKYLEELKAYNKTLTDKLSFFEIMTVLSFKVFHDLKLDVIVIEVGIGGLKDVTNVLDYDLSLITNIGHDHLEKLGGTINSVLYNKLGIVKDHGNLVTTIDESFTKQINSYCQNKQANLTIIKETDYFKLGNNYLTFKYDDHFYQLQMIGDYQIKNALLAFVGLKTIFKLDYRTVFDALFETKKLGRMDLLSKKPLIMIDGAHNYEAAYELKLAVLENFPNESKAIIMSILKGKDYHAFITEMLKITNLVIVTEFPDPRVIKIDEIKKAFPNLIYIKDLDEAYQKLLSLNKDYNLVTGSIHFIGYFKNKYFNK